MLGAEVSACGACSHDACGSEAFDPENVVRARAVNALRTLFAAALLLGLSACASLPVPTPAPTPPPKPTPTPLPAPTPERNPLAQWYGSPNYSPRRPVLIVLHQTEMDSADGALYALSRPAPERQVSAHYLIHDDGRLYQLVSEQDRAWHAGLGRWGGIEDLNSASIGIELDNDGSEPFSEAQIQTLLRLLQDITQRLWIPPQMVIGHGDIAPTRKHDPSALFPWQRLAQAGFGLWPREQRLPPPPGFDPWAALRTIGYDLRDPAAAQRAFHRHYRGQEAEGWLPGDDELLFDLQQQLMELPAAVLDAPTEDAP